MIELEIHLEFLKDKKAHKALKMINESNGLDPEMVPVKFPVYKELISALSEAKEIIGNLPLCHPDFPVDPQETQAGRWLSRYFPDTRKEG